MNHLNCLKIEKFSLFYYHFLIVDTDKYLVDGVFKNKNIKAKYKGEFRNNDEKYIITHYKIPKNKINKLAEVLEDLKNKMLLLGHTDYPEFCKDLFTRMRSME